MQFNSSYYCTFSDFFSRESEKLPISFCDATQSEILSQYGLDDKMYGILFIGEFGTIYVNYAEHFLLPKDKFRDFQPPQEKILESPGHHAEWLAAVRSGAKTSSDFEYSGKLSEAVLLALASYRCGRKFEYDASSMSVSNCPEADRFLRHPIRPGWE